MTTEDDAQLEDAAARIADGAGGELDEIEGPPGVQRLAELARGLGRLRAATSEDAPDLFSWGRLRVLRRIGEGGFGEVFAAWDPMLEREVALKLRASRETSDSERWLKEARRLARVRHPNVVTVHGADVHDGRAGLWMDLVRGETLEALLRREGAWSATRAAAAGLDLCSALAAVHAAGLVHGDLKLGNVLQDGAEGDSPGRLVLTDFGSAFEQWQSDLEAIGHTTGTPLTMAPEVFGGAPLSPQTDLYALGVLLYRLATAAYPVEAESLEQLRERHERGERVSLRTRRPDLPPGFVRAVDRAIDPDPARRYASAGDFERALHDALDRGRSPWRRRRTWAVVVASLAVVSAFGWIAARGPAKPQSASPSGPESHVLPANPPASLPASAGAPGTGGSPTSQGPTRSAQPGDAPDSAAASAPGASRPIQADASLVRLGDAGPVTLANGDRVSPGDQLALDLVLGQPSHVYVLDEDDQGARFVLFPIPTTDLVNPLPAGSVRVPGEKRGHGVRWQITTAGGRESFLVIVSRAPLRRLEDLVASLAHAQPGRPVLSVPNGVPLPDDLRGAGGIVVESAPRPEAEPGRLAALEHALLSGTSGDVWARRFELENPRR